MYNLKFLIKTLNEKDVPMKIASFLSFVKMRPSLKKGTCQMSSVVVMNRLMNKVTKLKQQKTT